MQAEMMEFDIRRTKDGVIVVHHDFDFAGHEIKAISKGYLEVILGKEAGYKVPTLQETLEFCAGKIPVDIELKETGYEGPGAAGSSLYPLTRPFHRQIHSSIRP